MLAYTITYKYGVYSGTFTNLIAKDDIWAENKLWSLCEILYDLVNPPLKSYKILNKKSL